MDVQDGPCNAISQGGTFLVLEERKVNGQVLTPRFLPNA